MLRYLLAQNIVSMAMAYNVIVIGGGAAGLSSALEASAMGANVILLEKMPKIGGNSAKASSGINGCMTDVQAARNVVDSYDVFEQDTLRTANALAEPSLVNKLVHDSTDAIAFLISLGLPLADVIQLGGHSIPRTHRLSTHAPIGFTLINTLQSEVQRHSRIQIRTDHTVTSLLSEQAPNGQLRVSGVMVNITSDNFDKTAYPELAAGELPAEGVTIRADAVIIASGGSAFDQSEQGLMSEFAPSLRGMATSSGPQADGHGIKIARALGVDLVNMDRVQVHPTGFIDPKNPSHPSKILAPEALRGSGGVLINDKGRRFANELGSRGYLTARIQNQCTPHAVPLESGISQPVAFMVMDQKIADTYSAAAIGFYVKRGLFREFDNAEALCSEMGFDLVVFKKTFSDYSSSASIGVDEFNKVTFPQPTIRMDEKLYVAAITPVIHYTLGGIRIDEHARALRTEPGNGVSRVVKGLYAAGESSGGVHGADRLAGNSLLECIVYGRTAGRHAAASVHDTSHKEL